MESYGWIGDIVSGVGDITSASLDYKAAQDAYDTQLDALRLQGSLQNDYFKGAANLLGLEEQAGEEASQQALRAAIIILILLFVLFVLGYIVWKTFA